jgi:exopolysaccharide biosynthesis polyprenyl glycosylphosphotransferase
MQAAPRSRVGALQHAARWRGATTDSIPEGRSQGAVVYRDALYRRLLATADIFAAALTIGLGISVVGVDRVQPGVLVALPGVVLISKIVGLYDRDEHLLRKTTLDEVPSLFVASAIYSLLLWLGGSLFVVGELTRQQVSWLWILLFLAMTISRTLFRRVARARAPVERCLVIGDADGARTLSEKMATSLALKATIVGRVPLEEETGRRFEPRSLGHLDTLGLLLVEHEIHRVIIVPGEASTAETLDAIRVSKAIGVKVSVLPRMFEVVGSSARFDEVDGLTLLAVPRYGLSKSSAFLKRSMDVIGAGVGLLVLAPLMVISAIAIKLDSRGPVFFRQTRIGKDGVPFEMLKFRSMVDRADERKAELADLNEADGLFKIADDPRITRVGRLLRQTSLDELPQLINVLRGEMSLVGPRPLVADDDRRVQGWHRRRLHLPPGMTGHWQVLGSSRVPLHEMVKIDYLYCGNWSLWGDVKLLLRTLPLIIARRGM